MAKYLWQGRPHSDSAIVDKYCWNYPGNWKIKQLVDGLPQWVATDDIPDGGDEVIIGGEAGLPLVYNSDYSRNGSLAYRKTASALFRGVFELTRNDSSLEEIGWEPAKCPLLFGGYSGDVGLGTWSMTSPGASASYGNTWTNSLANVFVKPNGLALNATDNLNSLHSSFPFMIGTGLTGLALKFAIAHDQVYHPQVTESTYTIANSSGFRDPQKPMTLKVSNRIIVEDETWHELPGIEANAVGATLMWLTNLRQLSINDLFKMEFNAVQAYKIWSGHTGNGIVATELLWNSPGSGQITVNGGVFKKVDLNSTFQKVKQGELTSLGTFFEKYAPTPGDLNMYNSTNPRAGLWWTAKNYLNNVVSEQMNISNVVSTNIQGGTVGTITTYQSPNKTFEKFYDLYRKNLHPTPWGTELPRNPEEDLTDYLFWEHAIGYIQPPIYINCNFDKTYVWQQIYTNYTPGSTASNNGNLVLSNRPYYADYYSAYIGIGSNTTIGLPFTNVSDYQAVSFMSYALEYYVPKSEIVFDRDNYLYTSLMHDATQSREDSGVSGDIEWLSNDRGAQVILSPNSNNILSIPLVEAYSTMPVGDKTLHKMIAWSVVPNGNVIIDNLILDGSSLFSGKDMAGTTNAIRVGRAVLKNHGQIDFGRFDESFDDWRFGGISGNAIVGGIDFNDGTGIIYGSPGVRLTNTARKGNVDVRASASTPDTKVNLTYRPTSSTP